MAANERIATHTLHQYFIDALGDAVTWHGTLAKKPLELDIVKPYPLRLRVYIFNCTNPAGGRPVDEYKSQLIVPNQKRGTRGNFDNSDGRLVILAAYARIYDNPAEGVFILYDALYHTDFSYSANLQVKASIINHAFVDPISYGKKNTGETIIAARPEHLLKAIDRRIITP